MKMNKSHLIMSLVLLGLLFLSISSVNAEKAVKRAINVTSHQIDCQTSYRLTTPTDPQFQCTKFCKDCQTCETYCCAGTTPEDLDVVYIDDDE